VTLSAGGVVPPALPYLWMIDMTGQIIRLSIPIATIARHFKRGSICGLLGRLGASRVLGRLRGPVQRVTLPVVSSWAGAGRQLQQIINCFFSFASSARSAASCCAHASLASGLPGRNDL
jgi:hypothetical protein